MGVENANFLLSIVSLGPSPLLACSKISVNVAADE